MQNCSTVLYCKSPHRSWLSSPFVIIHVLHRSYYGSVHLFWPLKAVLVKLSKSDFGKTCAVLERCVAVLCCRLGSKFPLQYFKAVIMHTILLMALSLHQYLIGCLNFYWVWVVWLKEKRTSIHLLLEMLVKGGASLIFPITSTTQHSCPAVSVILMASRYFALCKIIPRFALQACSFYPTILWSLFKLWKCTISITCSQIAQTPHVCLARSCTYGTVSVEC